MAKSPRIDPPAKELIPTRVPDLLWKVFFVATRAMVNRHTPKLLTRWDDSSRILAKVLPGWKKGQAFSSDQRRAFRYWINILESPENLRRTLWPRDLVALYDRTREVLAHCSRVRSNYEKSGVYEPIKKRWAKKPTQSSQDSAETKAHELYRLALSQVFPETAMEEDILIACCADAAKPAQVAYTILGHVLKRDPQYLAQEVSKRRRKPRPQPIVSIAVLTKTRPSDK